VDVDAELSEGFHSSLSFYLFIYLFIFWSQTERKEMRVTKGFASGLLFKERLG